MQKRFGYNIFVILAGAILLIILVFMVIVLNTNRQIQPVPEPSPTQSEPSEPQASPGPWVLYAPGSAQKMISKLVNRAPLSSADIEAKEKILSLLPTGQVSGVLYSTSTIVIDYTKAADQFQVEILTIDFNQAKRDAVAWFKSQSLSQEGVCNLPVVFYINRGIVDQLENSSVQFSPLAEGC